MRNFLIIPSLFLSACFLFISCESDSTFSDSSEETEEISSSSVSGFLNSEVFTPATTNFEKGELFGDQGYDIKLFQEIQVCDEFQSVGDISFFVEAEGDLSTGTYEAKGPYFHYKDGEDFGSVSYFGAEVIIEAVTETTISGLVRGGADDKTHYIEGKFLAELCQK